MKMEQGLESQVPATLKNIPTKPSPLPENLSPQCIGREFVRCYYTLLHDNPSKLHRFYLDQSTFIHGNQTDDAVECVTGQKAIHEKIMTMKFEDCRTKIKHVDSQATIAEGVVVQVSGELSNAGQLPRRFMQTFVLGSQTPRKYYVHNDIFRYQDEVFGCEHDDEEEEEEEVRSTGSIEHDVVRSDDSVVGGNNNTNNTSTGDAVDYEDVSVGVGDNAAAPAPNGNMGQNNHEYGELDYHRHHQAEGGEVQDEFTPEEEEEEAVVEESAIPAPLPEDCSAEVEVTQAEVPVEMEQPKVQLPKGPKSWAMIAGAGSAGAPAPGKVAQQQQQQLSPVPPPKPTPEPREQPQQALNQTPQKKESTFQPFAKDSSDKEGGRPKSAGRVQAPRGGGIGGGGYSNRYQEREAPNNHQIFVGNLPTRTESGELGGVFKDYGEVIHVRVTPNNFGFVVFDNEAPVNDILTAVKKGKKYYLHDQRLNVEEKKTGMGSNRGPRKPFSDRRNNSRGRRGGSVQGRPYNDHNNSELK